MPFQMLRQHDVSQLIYLSGLPAPGVFMLKSILLYHCVAPSVTRGGDLYITHGFHPLQSVRKRRLNSFLYLEAAVRGLDRPAPPAPPPPPHGMPARSSVIII